MLIVRKELLRCMKKILRRCSAVIIDYWIIIAVVLLFQLKKYMYILVFTLFILKDLAFKNASIGKKICGLEVRMNDNTKPPIIILLIRNFTILIYPIEILMIIFFGKRIGDYIFKTSVVVKK